MKLKVSVSSPLITDLFFPNFRLLFWVFDTQLTLGRHTADWVECQLNPASQQAKSVRACVLSVSALHPPRWKSKQRKRDSCEKLKLLKIRNLIFDRFLGFSDSERESYSYYWFTEIGRRDITKLRRFFEMKIRTEGKIFRFYFCQFFLSIYSRSQKEIALFNQT